MSRFAFLQHEWPAVFEAAAKAEAAVHADPRTGAHALAGAPGEPAERHVNPATCVVACPSQGLG